MGTFYSTWDAWARHVDVVHGMWAAHYKGRPYAECLYITTGMGVFPQPLPHYGIGLRQRGYVSSNYPAIRAWIESWLEV